MQELHFHEAWCVSFKGPNGLDEHDLPATTLAQAKEVVGRWLELSWREVTIKQFRDGDLVHQWDLKGKRWVQYE